MQEFLVESGGRYPTPSERSLYAWAKNQRSAHAGTGERQMTEARAARLEGLPGWLWTIDLIKANTVFWELPWESQLLELQTFLGENGGRYPSHVVVRSPNVLSSLRVILGMWAIVGLLLNLHSARG